MKYEGGLKNFWMHDRTRPRDKPLLKQTLDNFILQLQVLPQEPNVVIMEVRCNLFHDMITQR